MRALVLAVVATLALGGRARAEGYYLSETFGGARVHGPFDRVLGGGVRLRLGLGVRQGAFAAEGWFGSIVPAGELLSLSGILDTSTGVAMFGVDLKYLETIAPHWEMYVRAGLSHASVIGTDYDGYAGRGVGGGSGVAYHGRVRLLGLVWPPLFFSTIGPKVDASAFADFGYDYFRLRGDEPARLDGHVASVMAGFAVGSRF